MIQKKLRSPKISVVMPVYNSASYLGMAIDSILNQSFSDFEFIIIDDGSDDSSYSIIQSYKDSRIRLFNHKVNKGITFCLNMGINLSRGEFIARMDSDDVCEINRLEEQWKFMQNHTYVALCGTCTKIIQQDGKISSIRDSKVGDQQIKIALFLGETSIAHPTAIIRREFLVSNRLYYDPNYLYAEDYDLWCRISKLTVLENLNEPLVRYRIHDKSVSSIYKRAQRLSARASLSVHLNRLGLSYTPKELNLHYQFALPMGESITGALCNEMLSWKNKLLWLNNTHAWFNSEILSAELEQRYRELLNGESELGDE